MKIAIGCDPNAKVAKEELIKYIEAKGYGEVTDFGSEDPIYANTAIKVAEAVAAKEYDRVKQIMQSLAKISLSVAAEYRIRYHRYCLSHKRSNGAHRRYSGTAGHRTSGIAGSAVKRADNMSALC